MLRKAYSRLSITRSAVPGKLMTLYESADPLEKGIRILWTKLRVQLRPLREVILEIHATEYDKPPRSRYV